MEHGEKKMKCKGKPKTNSNPGWKARRTEGRRKAAEERQAKYNALPIQVKLANAGAKVRLKLVKLTEKK